MADVARLAGVSAMTVSRALRREASVSERTRARVLDVIDEIGYVPDQAAGALSSGYSGLVAAIMPTLTVPLFGYIAQGLTDTLSHAGLQLFLGSSDYSPARQENILRAILRRRPEAIAIAGVGATEKAVRLLECAGVPVIEFLEAPDPPINHLVSFDPAAVARATVKYLARKNRRRLAIVAPTGERDRRGNGRVSALIAAAGEFGLPDPIVMRHGGSQNPMDQGARGATEATERRRELDALVFMTDYAAIGALSALRKADVSVPDDVAVFGFGNCEVARHVTPSLTTIGFNPVGLGVEIGKVMLSALNASRLKVKGQSFRLSLEFELIERESA